MSTRRLSLAYADPPYMGTARRTYGTEEVNHQILLEELYREYPDGWALSASMSSLWDLVPMIPREWGCRIAAWCKPFGTKGAQGRPQYCWEPVIFRGGRPRNGTAGAARDFLVSNGAMAEVGHRGANEYSDRGRPRFPGAKPAEFCYWLFELLNMKPVDEFVDLFPGTGRVTRAWETWSAAGTRLFV